MLNIDRVIAVTVGKSEVVQDCHCETVVISNNSANIVYAAPYDASTPIKAATGFAIPANTVLQVPFAAGKLAFIASDAGSDVRLLLLD